MKHDTHMTCSNFKTISNTSARHEYAHFNHHYSPWFTFWAVFPIKPMLLNYCRREVFLTHLFSRKTGDSYFWSPFILITVFWGLSAALWQCQSHQVTLAFGAKSDKCCAFRFTRFVYWVLEIGDDGDTQQCADRAGRHLGSSALHFRLQWVHQRGECSETCVKKEKFRFIDSPLILGYKHKYMQIHTQTHTLTRAQLPFRLLHLRK